jgi:solute carrier family 25 (mitochondrial carnitine/acylcarnitine transporter), member 20/29
MFTFDWYTKAKYRIDEGVRGLTGRSILEEVNTVGSHPTLLSTACFSAAGAMTGFAVSFIACPFELLKIGRQMSGLVLANNGKTSYDEKLGRQYRDRGTFHAGYQLFKKVGVRGLYSGIHLHASKSRKFMDIMYKLLTCF